MSFLPYASSRLCVIVMSGCDVKFPEIKTTLRCPAPLIHSQPDTNQQTNSVNMDPNTTILRVKRKRGTDPADALLLACKRIRPETVQSTGETVPEPDTEVENSVFKLVATVTTQVRWHGAKLTQLCGLPSTQQEN